MKLVLSFALLALADAALNAAPSNAWLGGRRGVALVLKGSKEKGFTYATRDGGDGSASFMGEAPKGGSLIRDAFGCARDAAKDVEEKIQDVVSSVKGGSSNDADDDEDESDSGLGRFWETTFFKEGGIGFAFGAGTAACLRKVNRNAAYAVGGACVAAQYVSRSDWLGCGGKLGWEKLDESLLGEGSGDGQFKCVRRAGRLFKDTVAKSAPTVEGYILGLVAGLQLTRPST